MSFEKHNTHTHTYNMDAVTVAEVRALQQQLAELEARSTAREGEVIEKLKAELELQYIRCEEQVRAARNATALGRKLEEAESALKQWRDRAATAEAALQSGLEREEALRRQLSACERDLHLQREEIHGLHIELEDRDRMLQQLCNRVKPLEEAITQSEEAATSHRIQQRPRPVGGNVFDRLSSGRREAPVRPTHVRKAPPALSTDETLASIASQLAAMRASIEDVSQRSSASRSRSRSDET